MIPGWEAFIFLVNSRPFSPGNPMSMKIRLGCEVSTLCNACSPSNASWISTAGKRFCNVNLNNSRKKILSSTTKILKVPVASFPLQPLSHRGRFQGALGKVHVLLSCPKEVLFLHKQSHNPCKNKPESFPLSFSQGRRLWGEDSKPFLRLEDIRMENRQDLCRFKRHQWKISRGNCEKDSSTFCQSFDTNVSLKILLNDQIKELPIRRHRFERCITG